MHKRLDLDVLTFGTDFGQFLVGNFPAENDKFGPDALPEFDRLPRTDIGLCRYMQIKFRCMFTDKHKHARIGDDQSVWFDLAHGIDIFRQLIDVLVV